MNVALSDEFMEALGKLNGNEIKKASKTIMSVRRESDFQRAHCHIEQLLLYLIWLSFNKVEIFES